MVLGVMVLYGVVVLCGVTVLCGVMVLCGVTELCGVTALALGGCPMQSRAEAAEQPPPVAGVWLRGVGAVGVQRAGSPPPAPAAAAGRGTAVGRCSC